MTIPKFELGETTVGRLVDLVAEQFPDNPAVNYHEYGIEHTWGQFRGVCDDVAKAFMAIGVEKGGKVAIWASNVPEWLYSQFGTGKMGGILVTVNTNYKSFELEYLMSQSDASTLVFIGGIRDSDEYLKIIEKVCPELENCKPGKLACKTLPKLKNVVYIGEREDALKGMYTWDDILKMGQSVSQDQLGERQASLSPDDVVNMQYTSGTTGFPKGVMLSHTNIIGNAKSIGACMNLSSTDNLCIPVPFFHCFGCVLGTLTCVVSGAAMSPVTQFKPDTVLETVEANKCTALHGVPTMFIAELEEMENRSYDTSTLRTGIMAGSPCPIEVMKKVVDVMGITEMTIAYGQTEASPVITQTRPEDSLDLRVSTVGRALPNVEVTIVDPDTDEPVENGVQGELCTRGYHVMKGYFKNSDATENAICKEGWLHTGDLAVMDDNGYCKITGRIKDMIIRGGENIYPREIEEFLYTHPKVLDVQVVGVPSLKYGEEVAAYIQLRKAHTSDAEEFRRFCSDKIAFHKIPAFFFFVEDYPTTASGKIQKYKLRELATEALKRQEAAEVITA